MSSHLTLSERSMLEAYHKAGYSCRAIALELGRSASTISRELKRNMGGRGYRHKQAHRMASSRIYRPKVSRHAETVSAIMMHLRKAWSPEQIFHRFIREGKAVYCVETIYRIIREDKRKGGTLYTHLRCQKRKRKRYGKQDTRGKIPNKINISQRPEKANTRQRLGDWEIDTMVGKKHKGNLLTCVDRRSRFVCISVHDNRKKETIRDALLALLAAHKHYAKTITSDNGKEFAMHQDIAKSLGVDYYFADPYASYQRGTNENTNGLIRQFAPKKTDFTQLCPSYVQAIAYALNTRPRKCLGWKTPYEVLYQEKVLHL